MSFEVSGKAYLDVGSEKNLHFHHYVSLSTKVLQL